MIKIIFALFSFSMAHANSEDHHGRLSRALNFHVQPALCTAAEFAKRLNSTTSYVWEGPDKNHNHLSIPVRSDFLCLMKEDPNDSAEDAYTSDIVNFTNKCDAAPAPGEKEKYLKALVDFFKVAEPYMKNLLCSHELKRIWIGGEGSTSYSIFTVVQGKPFLTLGLKKGVVTYSANPKIGLNGQLSWYEQKRTTDADAVPTEHDKDDQKPRGPQVTAKLKKKYEGRISDTSAILMNYLYHEYAHFSINGLPDAPAPQDYDTWTNKWKDSRWPSLFFSWKKKTKGAIDDSDLYSKDPLVQQARKTICFWGALDGADCKSSRISRVDPNYGELLMPQYSNYDPEQTDRRSPGFVSILSSSNATENYCEWLGYMSMSRYFDSITENLVPQQGEKYQFEIFHEIANYNAGSGKNFRAAARYLKKQVENMDRQLTRFQ